MSKAIKFYCDADITDAIVMLTAHGKGAGWDDDHISSAVESFLRDERTRYYCAHAQQRAVKSKPKPALTVVGGKP